MNRPTVLVVTRRMMRKNRVIDYLGEIHFEFLMKMRILPVMVPSRRARSSVCRSTWKA